MKPIIADSSGLISLANDIDRNHHVAISESEKYLKEKGTIIIPGDVFTETINIMGKKIGHTSALGTAMILLQEPVFLIIDADDQLRRQALEKFRAQKEGVSLTDCIVMACADRFETKIIFGFDEVFKKNGFNALIPV